MGEAFAMSVLFGISKRPDVSIVEGFTIASVIIITMAMPVLCLVKDPQIKSSGVQRDEELQQLVKNDSQQNRVSINEAYEPPEQIGQIEQAAHSNPSNETDPKGLAKISFILRKICNECARDPKYILCFIGAAVIRLISVLFSTFLILWVASFVDNGCITEK